MESKVERLIGSILAKRVLTHVLFWSMYLLLAVLYGLGFGQPVLVTLILRGILLPVQILATYIFIYTQLPLLPKRKYFHFAASFILTSYIFTTLVHLQNDFGLGLYLSSWHQPHDLMHILSAKSMFLRYLTDIYALVFCVTAIRLIHQYFKSRRDIENLLAEKAKSEYDYINARLQPEFLLRTLKMIEDQAKENNKLASRSIEHLSTILDYSLYQGQKEFVPIEDELNNLKIFIKSYVDSSVFLKTYNFQENYVSPPPAQVKPLELIKLSADKMRNFESRGETHAHLVLGFQNGRYSYE